MRRCGAARARFHASREFAVQGGDGNEHLHQVARRQRCKEIDVTFDQGRLGDDAEGMTALGQHLDDGARDAELAFDGLVNIGVAAERDGFTAVAGLGQLASQDRGRIGLGKQPALEVQARR
jgi:hypothetical protein